MMKSQVSQKKIKNNVKKSVDAVYFLVAFQKIMRYEFVDLAEEFKGWESVMWVVSLQFCLYFPFYPPLNLDLLPFKFCFDFFVLFNASKSVFSVNLLNEILNTLSENKLLKSHHESFISNFYFYCLIMSFNNTNSS